MGPNGCDSIPTVAAGQLLIPTHRTRFSCVRTVGLHVLPPVPFELIYERLFAGSQQIGAVPQPCIFSDIS